MNNFDVESAREKVAIVAKKHNIKLVALFGSQATGAAHIKSDVDIAVMGQLPIDVDDKLKLMTDFSETFKREDIEVVDLKTASPTLMYVVVRDGKLLYETSSNDFLKWKLYAIRVWMETAWLRALRDMRLIQWAEKTQQKQYANR